MLLRVTRWPLRRGDATGRPDGPSGAPRAGPGGTTVSGATGASTGGSTDQVRDAGTTPTFPAPSIARTLKVCGPAASALSATGEEHAANGAPSTAHSNDTVSVSPVNVNVAVVAATVPVGPAVIEVSGAVVSTFTVSGGAESADVFPAASDAVAVYACEPSATPVSVFDHAPDASAVTVPPLAPLSNSSTVLPASAVPDSATVPVAFQLSSAGELITGAAGAAVSTFTVSCADAADVFPASSDASAV